MARLAGHQDQRCPCLHLPSTGITGTCYCSQLSHVGSKTPDLDPRAFTASTLPAAPFPRPPEQHVVCCDICHGSRSAKHVRISRDILFSRKQPRQDSNRKCVPGDMAMAHHSAMQTLEGHPLTTSLCPSVTMHTFSPHHLYQVSRWQSLTAAGSEEEAGEDCGPTPPFSPSDSQSSLANFYTGAVRVLPRGELGVWAWSA